MCKIKDVFTKTFEPWHITIDDADIFIGNYKAIPKAGWNIKYSVQEDEKGMYLEYYGIHTRNEHSHVRIYFDGQEEKLDVLREYIAYSPNIPGDRERGTIEFKMYNQRILNELKEKQLI